MNLQEIGKIMFVAIVAKERFFVSFRFKRAKNKQSGLAILELIVAAIILSAAVDFYFSSACIKVGNYRLF